MISSNRNSHFAIISGLCLSVVLAIVSRFSALYRPDSAAKTIHESWRLMQEVGQYDFSTTIEQVRYPAPALANVGESSTKEVYQVSGQADLHNNQLAIQLFKNQGSLLNQGEGLEIRVQDEQVTGRLIGSTQWEPLDNFSSTSYALGNNGSSYLESATGVRNLGSQSINLPNYNGGASAVVITRYQFDVDPDKYSVWMRDQMVQELQRSGKLPLGMNLSVSDQYRQMVSSGEVWVNADGLPVRMLVTMKMPPEKNGDHIVATLTTDYYNHHTGNLLAAQPLPYQIWGGLGLPTTGKAAGEFFRQISLLFICALLSVLVVVLSRKKYVYSTVAVLTILSMLVSPLWQSEKSAVFARELQTQNSAKEAEPQQDQSAPMNIWDAHTNPLEKTRTSSALNPESQVQTASSDAANLLRFPAEQMSEPGESELDSDQDGLTDSYESQHAVSVLNPHKADTDADGLNDNIELLLNLSPGERDTDGDGIWDNDEVRSFYYGDRDWYINPEERDTDMDGQIDGVECAQRVDGNSAGICKDTDEDLTPDVFDTDDDQDGVPTSFDESPYVVSNLTYSQDHPLTLSLSNLDLQPVFINYQLIPTNKKHLTYALNVLDWPSKDTDGQVQRISDTTFSDLLTPEQTAADPRAQYGDMRLIPTIEIKLTGDSYPFPLSRVVSVDVTGEAYTGAFEFSSSASEPGKTHIKLTAGEIALQTIQLGQGDCEEFTLVSTLNLHAVNDSIRVEKSLGDLVSGDYVLFLTDSANGSLNTCSPIPVVAHGKLTEYVIDSTVLQAYGGAARNDTDGNVLVYAPLSVVYDETGGRPAALSTKIPFTNIFNGFASSQQEVRVIWMINMLADQCQAMPTGYSESSSGTWCNLDIPARWNKNVSQVIHTYTDAFTLAGLSVVEDHGIEMAVIFENPATDPEPNYDDPLWGMTRGLERSFLAGRSADGENLDITIDEIQRRFDPTRNANISDMKTLWGFDKDTFRVSTYSYDNFDGVSAFIGGQVNQIFNTYFQTIPEATRPNTATLLFARQISQRATSIGEPTASCSQSACTVDFAGLAVFTQALINWAPYQRQGDAWRPYSLNDYLDQLEAHLRSLDLYKPADNSTDARNYTDGQIALAQIYYQNLFNGSAMLVAVNGLPIINLPGVLNDEDVYTEFHNNNLKGQIVGKVTTLIVTSIMVGFQKNPSLLYSAIFGNKTDTVASFFRAFGKGAAEKVSPITKLLTNNLRKVALGVAVVVLLTGIAVMAVLYLNGNNSPTGMWAGRILFATLGTVSAVLAGVALSSAIKSLKCVSDSARSAAIIGAVIGIGVTWGIFFYTWGTSGVSFGSVAFNNNLAEAIAATATIVLLAALACTGVGAIIVAVIALIDALIMTICTLTGANDKDEDHWARQYVCLGISGWVSKIFKWVLYSNTYLIDYENANRLSFNSMDQELENISAGMTYGNHMKISVGVENTITKSSVPFDWKAAAYFWQFSDRNAKSSTFGYKLQPSENDIHGSLNRDALLRDWLSLGNSKWTKEFSATSDGFSIPVPQAGINQDPKVYISEGSALPVQECWAIFIPGITPVPIPICYIRTEKATVNSEVSSSLTVDSFPANLDGFYTLVGDDTSSTGMKLSWGQNGSIKFPILQDADGDGLRSTAFAGGNDPNDTLYDSDSDGLGDFFELAHSTNPRMVDTDDDGLDDRMELRYMTSPTRKDTDGDGLTDFEESKGWLYTYDFTAIGAPLETMVYPDPLMADSDLDGLTDYLEKVYGFHPRVPQDSNVLDYELTMREQDSPRIMLRLNEDSGAMMFADSSNFGFAASCVAAECPISGIDGRYAAAVRFDGTDLLRLPTSAKAISLGANQPFTIAAWVNTTAGGTLFAKWSDAAGGQQALRYEITSDLHLRLISPTADATSSALVPGGQWTFISAVFDGSLVTFLIDGNPAGTSSFSTAPAAAGSTDAEILLGAYQGASGPSGYYQGAMDEFSYFDYAQSSDDLTTRWMAARYNFNDSYVRPGEEVIYQSKITNLLNSRFAYGLLTTIIDKTAAIVAWASKIIPTTFVLYPDNPVVTGVNTAVIETRLKIEPNHTVSENVTITQTASAQIVDRRSESNLAELWLNLDETGGAVTFIDNSGSMPPRNATCSNCPTSNQTGILNKAVLFQAGQTNRINLPNLSTLNLLNRGYTLSMWVKPASAAAGSRIPLLMSDSNRLSITLVRQTDGSFLPEVLVNNTNKVGASWRTMNASVWSHLVVEYFSADNTLKVYINGGQIVHTTATALTSDAALWLGGAATPSNYVVDDLRIFSRPLTVTDINRLAERPVLALNMDSSSFGDSSVYNQPVSIPHNRPANSNESVRGTSLSPGSGAGLGFVRVNGNSLLDLSDGSFTVSVWVYPTSQTNTTWQGIFGDRESGVNAYPTLERQGAKLRFGFGDGASYRSHTTANILTQSKWNMVTVTFAPSLFEPGVYTFKLYIDSVLKESKNFTTSPVSRSSFYVGVTTRSFTTSIYRLNMDDEHDAGSQAEVYVEEYINGEHTSNPMGETDMSDGDHKDINYSKTLSNFDRIEFTVWEEDSTSADDNCGSFTRYWYDLPDASVKTLSLDDGFDGTLTYQMTKPSIEFYGLIDEMQVYRYELDSKQVYDMFFAIPVTARLPQDDRPSSTTFENKAMIGLIDDGTCSGVHCPAAGTIGLINQATRFDGVDDVISVPVTTTSNYMVSLWLNSACNDCGVFSLQNNASIYHQLYLKSGNICSLVGSNEMCSQGSSVTNGQWHFVVYANNGSTADLWLDGVKVNSLTGSGAVASPGTSAQLGYAPQAQKPNLNGQLDDVRVFRYAQDAAVIAAIQQRAPLFFGHLDEPDGSTLFDDATPNNYQLGCAGEACPTGGLEGRLRQAVAFNQNSDVLTLNQAGLSSSTTAFSASLWIYPTQNKANHQSILTILNGSNTQPRYALSIPPDSMYLSVQHTQGMPADSIPQSHVELIKNTWNMITLVVERNASNDGENLFLYINGYLDSSWASPSISAGLGKIYLGNSAGFAGFQSGPYAGKMDEVAVYEYALNEIDIRETFAYQMGQVEETSALTMTIDADLPQAALVSYNPDFAYMDEKDRVLHVEASDITSGIGMVEMQVEHADAPAARWTVAPVCQDGPGGTAFCPTFIPEYGDGIYQLTFRAVDQVGHQASTAVYPVLVDNKAPKIFVNLQDGSLYNAEPHSQIENTWFLRMAGQVLDDTLSQGSPGSGLDLDSMKIAVYSENGEKIGAGVQVPTLVPAANGYNWNLDFLFPESEPTGALTVVIEVKDRVGNPATKSIAILLDASVPSAQMESNQVQVGDALSLLDAGTLDGKLISAGTVSGSVHDVPRDAIPYITSNGKRASSGVNRVEAAFEPSLGVSYLFNEPYPDGLLAWLPLDNAKLPEDASGNPDESAASRYFMDISPFQFAGICSGENCPINGETGHKNGAVYFDGQEKLINLGSHVDLANRSFSALVWARRDGLGHSDPFLWQGPLAMASQRFLFGLDYDNRIACGFGGSDLLSVEAYPDTAWHAYACTFDLASGRRVIYRDGQAAASDSTAPLPVMNEDLLIGYAPIGSFAGSLDELMVLDRELTPDEVREAYSGYQAVYHLGVQEKFLTNGDAITAESGFFQTGTLITGEGDRVNKVTAGAVGNYALHFDGSDVLALEPAFSLQLDRGAFTQTAWIKPAAGSGASGILSEFDENPEQRYPSIYLTEQYGLVAGFGDFYNWNEFSTPDHMVQPDAWNFIAARFDGKTYSLFVNGQLVAQTNAMEGKKPYTSSRVNIGEQYKGDIDDVKIFTRPLSDIEIAALARTGWREAGLSTVQAGLNWSSAVLPGLEGPYRVDVRGWDRFEHFDTGWNVNHQWSGVVDTLAPRFSFARAIDPADSNLVHYTFSVEDTLLDEESIHQNLCDEMEVTREYFNSSWFLSTGTPPNTSLYRLSGTCSGDILTNETTGFYACDLAGNCVMQEYPAYLPYSAYLPVIAGGGSTSIATLTPAMPSGVSADQADRALQWATLKDSLTRVDGGQAPAIEIWTGELTRADARSIFHTNLQGTVSDDGALTSVQVEIMQNGASIYTTEASVYQGIWNAVWIYPPGSQPANGSYIVRVSAVDAAGNYTTVDRDILVHLLP